MNLTRFILACLVRALLLLVVLIGVAFAPLVQTWAAGHKLFGRPGVRGSLGYLSARFGQLEVQDLHLEAGGTALTVPSLEASLPLTAALLHHQVGVRSLVAQGWTLDLSHGGKPAGTPAGSAPEAGGEPGTATEPEATPAQKAVAAFSELLSGWRLPCDLSIDALDLEGDVLVPRRLERTPVKIHVVAKGGGLAAGREGSFTIEATVADSRLPVSTVTAHGRLALAMNSPRTFSRLEVTADLSAQGGSLPKEASLAVDLAAARGSGEETYRLDLNQAGRHLATLDARYPAATRRLSGNWQLDLRDSDLTPFALDLPLPAFAAAGQGQFETDAGLTRTQAHGDLRASASRLEVLAPALERLGAVRIEARFDLTQSGLSFQVDQLDLAVTGSKLAASVRALQPFDFDAAARALKVANPAADWLEVSFRGLPLAWFSDPANPFSFAGEAGGAFTARAAAGGFSLRAPAPLAATGISLLAGERVLAQGLDLSLPLQADYNPKGWEVRSAPLQVSRDGQPLGTLEAKATQTTGPDAQLTIAGKWQADLAALTASPAGSWISGRSASGDFSVKSGATTEFEGKLAMTGRNPDHALAASIGAELDANGGISFVAPLKVTTGAGTSELSADGTWSGPGPDSRFVFKLTSENVALDHLGLIAGPLAAAGGVGPAAGAAGVPPETKDAVPFWSRWVGRVTVAFDHLTMPGHVLDDVGGAIEIDRTSLHLEGGRAQLARKRTLAGEGSVTFDPAAPLPYSLKAAGTLDKVETEAFFGPPPAGEQPVLQGSFALAGAFTGQGRNLTDLVSRTQEEFHLTGKDGILRLLKTSVAEVIPQANTPVKDALGSVGHAVGSFLEMKRTANADKNPISPSAEAVLNFTTEIAEVGYDQIKVTVRRDAGGTLQLSDLALTAPDARLTGSGRIDAAPGSPLRNRPLSLDLQFGARDQTAELLAHAGLLSGRKDDLGYSLLSEPVHFGGSLAQIDTRAWHDLLAKAATREPPPKK